MKHETHIHTFFFVVVFFLLLELLGEFGDSGEQVIDKTKVRNLEDGSLRVLVDSNNGLRILHTSQVLNGTRNTDGNVEIGGDDLTGLTDLEGVVSKARVNGSSRSTDGSTDGISKRKDELVKVLLVLQTTATRDNLGSRAEIRALRLDEVLGNPLG